LKFTIKDQENNAVSNALIQIGNNSILTDSQGEASICLLSGEFDYRVLKDGYLEYEGIVEILGEDEIEFVALVPNALIELESNEFMVYPNPFENEIRINEPDKVKRIKISYLDGRLLSELQTEGAATIETSFVPKGMYIVTVIGNDQSAKSFILTKR
ncbi:MAG: T9SS type A sorting domain-containing protein, partial [Bacteroidales bacterium]|nr:T9SS type A sorting domain-containing protein [Bacteroidales bacterium]